MLVKAEDLERLDRRREIKELVNRPLCLLSAVLIVAVGACATRTVAPPTSPPAERAKTACAGQGLASYYGPGFEGRITASGVRFDMDAMVAAHPSCPFGTVVRVTNLTNGRSVLLRVVDRGPAPGPRGDGVIIDVSQGAAVALDFVHDGRTPVRVELAGE